MPDHFDKPRAAGYFNNLLTTNPLKLMRKYSVCPPDNAGNTGTNVGNIVFGGPAPFAATQPRMAGSSRGDDVRLARIDSGHKVAYLNLKKMARGGYVATGNEGGDRVYFETATVDPGGWVPAYYLPWDTAGAAIRLTIPARNALNPGPNIFFTAAINGCSIFFQGTAQNPTIYHCGGDTGQGVNSQHGADFWREVMTEFIAQDAARGKNKGALFAQDVNKTRYVKTPGVGGGTLAVGQGTSTPAAMAYKQWLEDNSRNDLKVEQVNPWACVMGIRTGNDWAFFLQQNATVVYHQLYKKHWYSKKAKTETRYVARPLIFSQVFPVGRCLHRVQAEIPRIQ